MTVKRRKLRERRPIPRCSHTLDMIEWIEEHTPHTADDAVKRIEDERQCLECQRARSQDGGGDDG